MRQDVCFALIGGSSADGDRKLLTFARDDTKAVFGSLIVGMDGPSVVDTCQDLWEKRVEEFVERQVFFKKCLIMKWRMTLAQFTSMPHCVVAGNVLTRSESGPFTFTPDETQTVLQAGNDKERTRIDGGLLELLYTEALREWDSKLLVGDSGGLELSDALLVPKFTDALKDVALWWSRIFEEPRPMLSTHGVFCLALLYLSRIIKFERRKTWSEKST